MLESHATSRIACPGSPTAPWTALSTCSRPSPKTTTRETRRRSRGFCPATGQQDVHADADIGDRRHRDHEGVPTPSAGMILVVKKAHEDDSQNHAISCVSSAPRIARRDRGRVPPHRGGSLVRTGEDYLPSQ